MWHIKWRVPVFMGVTNHWTEVDWTGLDSEEVGHKKSNLGAGQ